MEAAVKCSVIPKEELEQMLAARYGKKLEPIREGKAPGVYGLDDICGVKQAAQKASKREKAKMLPKHLYRERLQELTSQGKTLADIARMYNASEQTIKNKAGEWGMGHLFSKRK